MLVASSRASTPFPHASPHMPPLVQEQVNAGVQDLELQLTVTDFWGDWVRESEGMRRKRAASQCAAARARPMPPLHGAPHPPPPSQVASTRWHLEAPSRWASRATWACCASEAPGAMHMHGPWQELAELQAATNPAGNRLPTLLLKIGFCTPFAACCRARCRCPSTAATHLHCWRLHPAVRGHGSLELPFGPGGGWGPLRPNASPLGPKQHDRLREDRNPEPSVRRPSTQRTSPLPQHTSPLPRLSPRHAPTPGRCRASMAAVLRSR